MTGNAIQRRGPLGAAILASVLLHTALLLAVIVEWRTTPEPVQPVEAVAVELVAPEPQPAPPPPPAEPAPPPPAASEPAPFSTGETPGATPPGEPAPLPPPLPVAPLTDAAPTQLDGPLTGGPSPGENDVDADGAGPSSGEAPPGPSQAEVAQLAFTQAVRSAIAPAFFAAMRTVRGSGTVLVEMEIDRQGNVRSARIAQSSGDAELDAAALGAARITRYPPLPPDVAGETLPILLPLRVR